jgi:hypothetical protein
MPPTTSRSVFGALVPRWEKLTPRRSAPSKMDAEPKPVVHPDDKKGE